MNAKLKMIKIKVITQNPLIEKIKAKKDQSFVKLRSKFS